MNTDIKELKEEIKRKYIGLLHDLGYYSDEQFISEIKATL